MSRDVNPEHGTQRNRCCGEEGASFMSIADKPTTQNRFVYLFELDSVRTSDDEICTGQQALWNEMVRRGNTVVLTYSQLVDSRGFFSLLSHQSYYENFVKLFEEGHIRISQYGEIRTLSLYLLSTIAPEKKFIYSALPLKSSQRRLCALMRRSLVYSDLSEIASYLREPKGSERVRDLFIEVRGSGTQAQVAPSKLNDKEMHEVLRNLYCLIATVLRLSTVHASYLPPRSNEELRHMRLSDILDKVLKFEKDHALFERAASMLRRLLDKHPHENNRSVWLNELRSADLYGFSSHRALQLGEAIVDLCYNYACEISICNTSKRYDTREIYDFDLKRGREGTTFEQDFFRRLKEYRNNGDDADTRFLSEETNSFVPFDDMTQMPDFSKAVHYLEYGNQDDLPTSTRIMPYSYEAESQQKAQKARILASIGKRLIFAIFCLTAVILLELFLNLLQDTFDIQVGPNTGFETALETILFLFLSEYISSAISSIFPSLPSLSEALGSIGNLIKDGLKIVSWAISDTPDSAMDWKERLSTESPIRFITPPRLAQYKSFRKANEREFAASEIYPIADARKDDVMQDLIRQEEISGDEYGLVYRSPFNTLLVDAIVSNASTPQSRTCYYPYERILPTAGDGAVIVPICHGKLVLLKQFRHALRNYQLSFPRGFAEPGEPADITAQRELAEEIAATGVSSPQYLGVIAPDSGLTSRRTRVYAVDIDSYQPDVANGNEGIYSISEVTPSELTKRIQQGDVDDGYTIGAFTLWTLSRQRD